MSNNKNILIAGVVRNGVGTIRQELDSLRQAFSGFNSIHYLIIESDSEDDTVTKLEELRNSLRNFSYKSMGNLSERMKLRTERIAFCRNVYLKEIETNPVYQDIDYIAIADLDGVNNLLSKEAVNTCFERDDWDVCTANQSGNYYDIWALRHPIWCPNDTWEQYRFLMKYQGANKTQDRSDLMFASVYSKMILLPQNSTWIPVDSSFGGLAIYKRKVLIGEVYVGVNEDGIEICEHVSLNLGIREKGFRIFINPALINTDFTNHSIGFKPKPKSTLYV